LYNFFHDASTHDPKTNTLRIENLCRDGRKVFRGILAPAKMRNGTWV
jgi:hypothetical protein